MCTTYLATELIREFSELDLIGNPRLVRLNPNVPWKTRGNGAVSIKLGKGRGTKKKIGEIGTEPIYCFFKGENTKPTRRHLKRAERVIEELAMFGDANTNPGLILTTHKPPQSLYWAAVRDVVQLKEHLESAGPDLAKGWKNRRGLIGATSAVAWRPRDSTHELIAYREKSKWGKSRKISVDSVIKMDKKFTTTFNNYDYEEKHLAFAPASPCPILYGIRGDVESALPKAASTIESEKKASWLVFLTNQGTDDHIQKASVSALEPFTSVSVRGVVASQPVMIKGGHLIFKLTNGKSTVDCAIYEPAKSFRRVGEALAPGDRVTVLGGVREKPFTINVEKLKIEKLARVSEKRANPLCRKCNKRMKSVGKNQGYRCGCGKKARENEAVIAVKKRTLAERWYEPPTGSRRHLSKPLKRM